MAVSQTKDGRWFVHYRKGANPDDPERTREYFGRGDQARIKANIRNDELGFGRRKPQEKATGPTFAEIALEWQQSRFHDNAESTLHGRFYKFSSVILPELGQVPIMRITPERLDRYVAKRLSTPVTFPCGPPKKRSRRQVFDADGKPRMIKKSTVSRELTDILAVMSWAARSRKISYNPCAGYKKPKTDDAIIRPPSPDEIQRLIEHAPEHLRRAITISWYTGIRPGAVELLSLKWVDVDWDRCYIFVRGARKGGPLKRPVPIDARLLSTMRSWFDEDTDKSGHIITWRGKPIKRMDEAWETTKSDAGITRRLRLYDIRHAFVTYLLEDGADLKSVSSIIGHANTTITTRTYQHVNMNLLRTTIAKMPDIAPPKSDAGHTKVLPEK